MKKYVIVTTYFHQYTWGITGQTSVKKIIKSFDSKEEATEYAKENGFKNKTIRGKNEGYGEVGLKVSTFKILTENYVNKNKDTKFRDYRFENK